MNPKRILIMGAGGRDFHVFNTCYRDDSAYNVVAFTAAQIPHIDDRIYPPELAGTLYPDGIPIYPDQNLESIIRDEQVDEVIFAYSDVSFDELKVIRERIESTGAGFSWFDPERTMLESGKLCIAICAVRTGCGKSPLSRYVASHIKKLGLRPAIVRHPMPYGNLRNQIAQRFASVQDLNDQNCTIEEMEEYEPHVVEGNLVFAGTDYQQVVATATKEADVLIWDGGNNDAPFIRPDLLVTILDPLRAGDETGYFPGKWNLEHADMLVVGKIDDATPGQLELLRKNIAKHNQSATVIEGSLVVELDASTSIQGKRVLVIEDGPTITHGGMPYGAGHLAAQRANAHIVDPREYAVGEIAEAFAKYSQIGSVLPALGYAQSQLDDLSATIERTPCDVVLVATPIDLSRVVTIQKPTARVTYRFAERGEDRIFEVVRRMVERSRGASAEDERGLRG